MRPCATAGVVGLMNETDATLLELTPEEQTLFFEGLVMSDTTTLASYELVRCPPPPPPLPCARASLHHYGYRAPCSTAGRCTTSGSSSISGGRGKAPRRSRLPRGQRRKRRAARRKSEAGWSGPGRRAVRDPTSQHIFALYCVLKAYIYVVAPRESGHKSHKNHDKLIKKMVLMGDMATPCKTAHDSTRAETERPLDAATLSRLASARVQRAHRPDRSESSARGDGERVSSGVSLCVRSVRGVRWCLARRAPRPARPRARAAPVRGCVGASHASPRGDYIHLAAFGLTNLANATT